MNRFNPEVIQYESLPSTNTEAARLAVEGAAEGLCVVADEQTAGRGRLQRSWLSPLKKQRRNVPIEKSSWRLCCARSHPGTYCCSRAGDSSRYWKPGPVVHPSQKGSA